LHERLKGAEGSGHCTRTERELHRTRFFGAYKKSNPAKRKRLKL